MMTETTFNPRQYATHPAMQAARLVSKRWIGKPLTAEEIAKDQAKLEALGCTWCPTCYGYQLVGHTCWTPEVVEGLGAEARAVAARDAERDALHGEALVEEAQIGQSLDALGLAGRPLPVEVAEGT